MKRRCEASYTVVPGHPGDASQIARLHADCFPKGWNGDEMGLYLSNPAYKVLAARSSDTGEIAGFVIYRASGGEAEILSLAVAPIARRQGIARVLWQAACDDLQASSVARVVLEVGEANRAARALYGGFGFAQVGRRRAYYQAAPGEPRQDGLIMACLLAPARIP